MATNKNVAVVVSVTVAVSTFLLVPKKTSGAETNDNKVATPAVVSTDTGRVSVTTVDSATKPSECFERPQQSFQLRVSAAKIWPGDDDSWEKASGANIDTIYWSTPSLGFGFELGFHSWYIKTQSMLETFTYQYTEQHYYPSTSRYVPGYYYYGYGGWLYYRPGYYQTVPGYYYTDTHTGVGTATWTISGKDRQVAFGPKVMGAKQYGKLRLTSELGVLYVMHDSEVTIGYRDNRDDTV